MYACVPLADAPALVPADLREHVDQVTLEPAGITTYRLRSNVFADAEDPARVLAAFFAWRRLYEEHADLGPSQLMTALRTHLEARAGSPGADFPTLRRALTPGVVDGADLDRLRRELRLIEPWLAMSAHTGVQLLAGDRTPFGGLLCLAGTATLARQDGPEPRCLQVTSRGTVELLESDVPVTLTGWQITAAEVGRPVTALAADGPHPLPTRLGATLAALVPGHPRVELRAAGILDTCGPLLAALRHLCQVAIDRHAALVTWDL